MLLLTIHTHAIPLTVLTSYTILLEVKQTGSFSIEYARQLGDNPEVILEIKQA